MPSLPHRPDRCSQYTSHGREASPTVAHAYLTEHGKIPDSHVRFDVVSMPILSEGKGLLRHHRNALSVGD